MIKNIERSTPSLQYSNKYNALISHRFKEIDTHYLHNNYLEY